MNYQGVKYRLDIVQEAVVEHPWVKELQHWCEQFAVSGLAPSYHGGSHGNLSFRSGRNSENFIITASNSSLKEASLSADFFCEVIKAEVDTKKITAVCPPGRKPSSEAMLHAAIYKARPQINAILHGHSELISKFSEKTEIVTTTSFAESGTTEIIDRVMEVLDQHNFIEIKRHGFLSLGKTIEEAGELARYMLKKCEVFNQ